jgi:DNA-binding NarL/FixJ family response regulator
MGILEIVLLLAGVILAVLSFLLPVKKDEVPQETKVLAEEEIKTLLNKEMDGIRKHVDDVVDEAVGYAVEKTERSLERLTNEKIMAVNEYSDTVLQEIQKNHQETMFLYDMLNDKHANLKDTVSEVNKTVQEVEESKREAEAVVDLFQHLKPETIQPQEEKVVETVAAPTTAVSTTAQASASAAAVTDVKPAASASATSTAVAPAAAASPETSAPVMDISFMENGQENGGNNNEQILKLYKQGKSKIAIAKELGLGVGEVKLVIDLYKNM